MKYILTLIGIIASVGITLVDDGMLKIQLLITAYGLYILAYLIHIESKISNHDH